MIRFVSSQKRKSRKNAHFPSQMCTLAGDNSERSLAIQNSVSQSTPLISKSLPVYLSINGNTLPFSKIVRKRKINKGNTLAYSMSDNKGNTICINMTNKLYDYLCTLLASSNSVALSRDPEELVITRRPIYTSRQVKDRL